MAGHGREWAPEEDAMATALIASGLSGAEVAAALGRSPKSLAMRMHLLRHRPEGWTPPHRWTEEDDARLVEMRAAGISNREIASELGVSTSGILFRIGKLRARGFSIAAQKFLPAVGIILIPVEPVDEDDEDGIDGLGEEFTVEDIYRVAAQVRNLTIEELMDGRTPEYDHRDEARRGVLTPRYERFNRPPETPEEERVRVLGEIRDEARRCRRVARKNGWTPRRKRREKQIAA